MGQESGNWLFRNRCRFLAKMVFCSKRSDQGGGQSRKKINIVRGTTKLDTYYPVLELTRPSGARKRQPAVPQPLPISRNREFLFEGGFDQREL